jgi:hypothetical protein
MRATMIVLACLGAALLYPAKTCNASVYRFDLPELIGAYTFDLSYTDFRRTNVQTAIPWDDVVSVSFSFSGTGSAGLARGDGYHFQADEVAMPDGLSLLMDIGRNTYSFTGGPLGSGSTLHYEIAPPFELSPVQQAGFFNVRDVSFFLDPAVLNPPLPPALFGDYWTWGGGLVLLQPATANISEAYMTVETAPEPATLTLLALGGLLALRRKARH